MIYALDVYTKRGLMEINEDSLKCMNLNQIEYGDNKDILQ